MSVFGNPAVWLLMSKASDRWFNMVVLRFLLGLTSSLTVKENKKILIHSYHKYSTVIHLQCKIVFL